MDDDNVNSMLTLRVFICSSAGACRIRIRTHWPGLATGGVSVQEEHNVL